MRVLILCKKFPFPLKDGESIAITFLSQALQKSGAHLTLLSMNTNKHHFDINTLPVEYDHFEKIHTIAVNTDISYWKAFKNLFSTDSYHVNRYDVKNFENKLKDILQNETFDIIQLETVYLTPYINTIKRHSNAKIVLRAHNIEHEIWQRIGLNAKNVFKKLYIKYLSYKLEKYELNQFSKIDLLLPVSQRDLNKFLALGYKKKYLNVPIGLNLAIYNKNSKSGFNHKLCFIGAMDWIPNQEGLSWFLSAVWTDNKLNNLGLELHITGRNINSKNLYLNHKNVNIYEEVSDALAFMNEYDVLVVPLFSGSGTRVKILEAMALGKIVISTSLGMEGIEAVPNIHFLLANDKSTWIKTLQNISNNSNDLEKLRSNAKEFVNKHYNYLHIGDQLMKKYKSII